MEEQNGLLIPYMVVSMNVYKFQCSSNVTPGSFSVPLKENYQEEMAKFFYEETAKFMIENSTTRFKTIREYNEYFCGKLNVRLIPFTLYFFYNKEWNVFLYSDEDLMALYQIRYRQFYYPETCNNGPKVEQTEENEDQDTNVSSQNQEEDEEEDEEEQDEEN